MSETKLFIHTTWSTNNRKVQLADEIRKEVCLHIFENAKKRSIEINTIVGLTDHIHVLIKLHPTQNLSRLIHDIKGESSNWINTLKLAPIPFQWQEGYFAMTVSPSDIMPVKKYFLNQELQHQNMTFFEEIKLLKLDKLPYVFEKGK